MRATFIALAALLAGSALAQTNVAASANGGTATQSSLWTAAATADKAIDGNRNGIWGANGIYTLNHTNYEAGAWLRVFFDSTYQIDSLNVWNRVDFFGTRIDPFSVRLYDGANLTYSSTGNAFLDNINDGLPETIGMAFNTGGVWANMMEIQLDGTNYLHVAEVEAFTPAPVPEPGILLALGASGLKLLKRRRRA